MDNNELLISYFNDIQRMFELVSEGYYSERDLRIFEYSLKCSFNDILCLYRATIDECFKNTDEVK